MLTILCENHFFENRFFRFLELYLALLGSSRPLPGQSWGPDGTQKPPKSDPKVAPKLGPKMDPILGCSWTHFGVHFGVQNGSARGAHFSRFFGVSPEPPSGPILASFWLHVGSVLAPSWPHPGLSWPLLAHLGPSWPHLGSILAPSWPLLAPLCALLAPSWHYSWPHLGSILAPSWPLLAPLCGRRSSGPFWVPAVHETPYMHDDS